MKSLLEKRLRAVGDKAPQPIRVVYADGSEYRNRDTAEPPAFTLRFKSAAAQWSVLWQGHIGLLDAYFNGAIDIEGDLAQMFALGLESGFSDPHPVVRVRNWWHEFRRNNATIARAKENARFHYGLGTDFYRYWLDRELMMYTCAYWKEGTRTIEEAQVNKVEHVCRKILLAPGETVVDIGCGFGGFMFYAAQKYGARAYGVNTTTEQVEWVREEIGRRGLSDRVAVREADFREVDRQYDKVVSIGVLEHAGRDQIMEVVKAHADFLKPGGLGMLHFIGHVGQYETEFFIRHYVFPGGWIPSLTETLDAMDACGLEILDIENLRRHYVLTLEAWAERFDAHWDRIHALDPRRFDERFRRIWRTYLIGCAEMFRASNGITGLFQITFGKGRRTPKTYPMSRAFLYQPEQAQPLARAA
ncbi:MAG: cyclopropane-fatty-acyl-phospholipid synthase family protein [Sutterellaceae bacterium]|nr:cyclopropane-fatty-acyl-phospholipid synthase family protein [Burkholderiaceae bacterium]MDW8430338.1 cyclopropane-fatty-acyl-phospholipid synthase family protein [Sutterellaceae bacterium]